MRATYLAYLIYTNYGRVHIKLRDVESNFWPILRFTVQHPFQYYPSSFVYAYLMSSSHKNSYQFPQCVLHVQLTLFT